MPIFVAQPTRIQSAGNKPKMIDEYIGFVNSKTSVLSVAHMKSPGGWTELGQTPEFDEYTLVLKGELKVASSVSVLAIKAGQAVIVSKGEWVQYSSPAAEGAEYVAICIPAFSPQTVHRDS